MIDVSHDLKRRGRWSVLEVAFWLIAAASIWLLPGWYLILTEVAILGLFALSLDLILGYAGIVSLGHAAFFGFGAYTAGLLAKHGIVTEPVLGLIVAGLAATVLGFITSFLVLRGSDLTRLMVTLGVALVLREIANRYSDLTGGADGLQGVPKEPILGTFRFDLYGHNGYVYCLIVLFLFFVLARRIVNSPFGLSLRALKGNPLRSSAIGINVNRRLIAIYTIAAGYAGIAGALLTQTTAFASLEVFSFDRSADLLLVLIIGGTGYLYGGLIGALIFKLMQDWIANLTPQYWQFWIGLVLVLMVLLGRFHGAIVSAILLKIMHSWIIGYSWLGSPIVETLIGLILIALLLWRREHIDRWLRSVGARSQVLLSSLVGKRTRVEHSQ